MVWAAARAASEDQVVVDSWAARIIGQVQALVVWAAARAASEDQARVASEGVQVDLWAARIPRGVWVAAARADSGPIIIPEVVPEDLEMQCRVAAHPAPGLPASVVAVHKEVPGLEVV